MAEIESILKSKKKPKETLELLVEALKKDESLISELIQCFEVGTAAEKGTCMETIEYMTKETPEFAEDCLDFVISHLNDDAPRVKWEASRIVGNVAHSYPDQVKSAIPKLLVNTSDKGTVVRWSAAFALTEIAKSNNEIRKELAPEFTKILEKEENNGVRNVYRQLK